MARHTHRSQEGHGGPVSGPRGLILRYVLRDNGSEVHGVSWSPDGRTLASASADCIVRLWKTGPGQTPDALEQSMDEWSLDRREAEHDELLCISWSPDGRRLAVGSALGKLYLWDLEAGRVLQRPIRHTAAVNSIAWSPNGQTLASASGDCTIRLWDPSSGRERANLSAHTNGVLQVSWSPDGRILASASADANAVLWDATSGRPLRTLEGHVQHVNSVSWSPDGMTVATASFDRTVPPLAGLKRSVVANS